MNWPFDTLDSANISFTHTLALCVDTHKWEVVFGKVKCERCKFDSGFKYPNWPMSNKVKDFRQF